MKYKYTNIEKEEIIETEYLKYQKFTIKNRKTKIVHIFSKHDYYLGIIIWHPACNSYVLDIKTQNNDSVIFDSVCLNDAISFIDALMLEEKKIKESKNDIDRYLIELEKNNETFKKWGDLYRIEENIINTIILTRKKKGLTQKELAEMIGIKQSEIAKIENKATTPTLFTLIRILDVIGLKPQLVPSTKS